MSFLNTEQKNKLIGSVVVMITAFFTFLVSAYFSSFATNARVDSIEAKLDKVLTGLCIIDKKTCILKDAN